MSLQQGPKSMKRLRDIKYAIMEATSKETGCITHSVTIHFFNDCWLGFHAKSNHGRYVEFTHKVYSKDLGKTWHPYNDQFEPATGYHRAVEYKPSNEPFPTNTW